MKLYPIPKWAIEMVEGSERVMIFLSVIAILVILILLFL